MHTSTCCCHCWCSSRCAKFSPHAKYDSWHQNVKICKSVLLAETKGENLRPVDLFNWNFHFLNCGCFNKTMRLSPALTAVILLINGQLCLMQPNCLQHTKRFYFLKHVFTVIFEKLDAKLCNCYTSTLVRLCCRGATTTSWPGAFCGKHKWEHCSCALVSLRDCSGDLRGQQGGLTHWKTQISISAAATRYIDHNYHGVCKHLLYSHM